MAQARQRLGRAGRQCPGQCYRLYTEEQFYCLESSTIPEIQRCNLSSVVLQLLALGVKDIVHFDFLNAPSLKAIENAWEQLKLLGALDEARNEVTILTSLHFTSSHFTPPHFTSLYLTPCSLYLTSCSLHPTPPHFTSLYFTTLFNPSHLVLLI